MNLPSQRRPACHGRQTHLKSFPSSVSEQVAPFLHGLGLHARSANMKYIFVRTVMVAGRKARGIANWKMINHYKRCILFASKSVFDYKAFYMVDHEEPHMNKK